LVITCDSIELAFTELICTSIESQDLEISSRAEAHIVEVVTSFTTATHVVRESIYLNDLLRKAFDSDGRVRTEYLRVAGDIALFVSGIFPDSIESRRTWFNLGDYIDIGQTAYDNINTTTFNELAIKFPEVVEMLNDVSIRINLASIDLMKYLQRRRHIDARVTRR